MKNLKRPIVLFAVCAFGLCMCGYPVISQQPQPPFSYKAVPKRFAGTMLMARANMDLGAAYDLTQSLPAGYVKDGSVDYTSKLQEAINNHQDVVFPDFPVMVNTAGLSLKSNTSVFFKKHSKVVLQSNSLPSYVIIKIYHQQNIKVYSAVVEGDRDNHQGTAGEGGMGIKIAGSSNITLYSPKVSKCWGDGIYLANDRDVVSDGITISNAQLDFNRRNGLTITGGRNISIDNALVSNTSGTPPMAGIDIEPNDYKSIVDNVSITGYTSYNNKTSGLQLGISNMPGPLAKSVNIKVDNMVSVGSYCGVIVGGTFDNRGGTQKLDGNIELSNIKVIDSQLPVKTAKTYGKAPRIHLSRLGIFKSNNSGSEDPDNTELKKLRMRVSNRDNISMD